MLIEKLPTELLIQVLNFVDSVQDLAQCRLVCKHLDCLAERAMFKKPIVVPSASKAKALRYHLTKKQELGKLITSLDFKTVKYNDTNEFIELLPLVLTPAMESLTGYIEKPAFFAYLVNFANTINRSFSHLKRLPSSARSIYHDEHYKALLLFRKTLQDVDITYYGEVPWNVCNRLDEFINLTALTMNGCISSVQVLDRMLAKCTRLQSLTLCLRDSLEASVMSRDALLIWMNTHVDKVSTLNKIEIGGMQQPYFVEYLCYKYPNMKEANIFLPDIDFNQPSVFFGINDRNIITERIRHIIDELQKSPLYRLHYNADIEPSVLEEIGSHVKSYNHSIATFDMCSSSHAGWRAIEVYHKDCIDK